MATRRKAPTPAAGQTADYQHGQEATQRPDVGVQDQFATRKPAKTYRYDSSLDPALSWDENRDRELAEWLIGLVQRCGTDGEAAVFMQPQVWAGGGGQVQSLTAAADLLQALSQPFLNWAGKAERHQISVPTVPLFVHERHSTKAILDGIKNRKAKGTTLDLFGDGGLDVTDKLDAYEHKGPWQNRMILGDSLQVMNSLLEFEGLGGQVQMIYMDPPYGVKFGSNFQPFVRKRDVKHGGDEDMTREPEMVKAYRDTWELGLHSYLTYMRDRLLLAKELLHETGSVFVQISDDNLHHVRDLMDDALGASNFVSIVSFAKTSSASGDLLSSVSDFIVWYAKDKERLKFRALYQSKELGAAGATQYTWAELADGTRMNLSSIDALAAAPEGSRIFSHDNLTSQRPAQGNDVRSFEYEGKTFTLTKGTLPAVKVTSGYPQELLKTVERVPRRIYGRMASWFIRHGTMVPIATPEFLAELPVRFRETDGMVFLPEQLVEYEKARARIPQVAQAELFVSDECSAIDWLTNFLLKRPSTRSEIHPEYIPQIGSAKRKGEIIPELDRLLEDNVLQYDGTGEVPSQIHSYLSTNHKDLRSLDKSNPALVAKAKDRWYVPDPNKAQDLEKKREKTLLKEFETYKVFTGRKIKESRLEVLRTGFRSASHTSSLSPRSLPRLEVLRTGFRSAWANKDYTTIISVANKLPEETLQEDEKLLTLYDLALTRSEEK